MKEANRVVDEDIGPGPEPSFAAADVLGGEGDCVDAGFGHREDPAVDVHRTLSRIHKAAIVSN